MTTAPARKTYRISAEHMSHDKCKEALAASGLKGVYPRIAEDSIFTAYYHIKIRGTKVQANRLQKAVWELHGGAFCGIARE